MQHNNQIEVKPLKAHVALNVKNVDRSIEFYKKLLGISPVKVREGYAKFDVEDPPLNFTLNQIETVIQGSLSHLGIQVGSTEEVMAIKQKWIAAGLTTRDEMQTNCCYALQDKTWVEDPDGNHWEAFVVLHDNLPSSTACCTANAVGPTSSESTSCC